MDNKINKTKEEKKKMKMILMMKIMMETQKLRII